MRIGQPGFSLCLSLSLSPSPSLSFYSISLIFQIHNFALRYADDTTLMAESEEELKILLMKVKEETEKVGLNSTFRKRRSWHLVPSLHGK